MTNKKAQLTMFIILGVLILLLMIVIIYYTTLQQPVQVIRTDLSNEVNVVLTNCLSIAADKSLKLLGEHGIISSDYNTDDYFNEVAYYIRKTPDWSLSYNTQPDYISTIPPTFPWLDFPINPVTSKDPFFTVPSLFGWNKIPQLEKTSNSWQKQIEIEAKKEFNKCINTFKSDKFFINPVDAQIEAVIGNDLTIQTPTTITFTDSAGSSGEIKTVKFRVSLNLKKVYALIRSMIDKEVTDITYQPTIESGVSLNNQIASTIVTVNDLQSSYKFKFALQNRPPALFKIFAAKKTGTDIQTAIEQLKLCPGTTIDFNQNKIKFTAKTATEECAQREIELKAIDPDDNILTYSLTPNSLLITNTVCETGRITAKVKDKQGLEDWQDIEFKIAGEGCE